LYLTSVLNPVITFRSRREHAARASRGGLSHNVAPPCTGTRPHGRPARTLAAGRRRRPGADLRLLARDLRGRGRVGADRHGARRSLLVLALLRWTASTGRCSPSTSSPSSPSACGRV